MFGVSLGIMDGAGGAAGGSYESIATAVGTGSSNTITFSSIPSTYKHLQIRAIARDTFASTSIRGFLYRLNSDTGANYSRHALFGDGSSVTAEGDASLTYFNAGNIIPDNNLTANVMGTLIIDIHDYASSTKNKTIRGFSGIDLNGSGNVYLTSASWMSTSPVTSFSIFTNSGSINFSTSTVFSLYGIKG
jgi:hypothetical protein